MRRTNRSLNRGVTLIDTVVATALLIIVFSGTVAALKLSLDIILNNKARAGAIALADERIEYVRSLRYASVGVSGGIPAGAIPQSETVTLNAVSYTRRTYVTYGDDPTDGTGASDADGTLDYKAVKVDVSWNSRTGTRDVVVDTRLSTPLDTTGKEVPPCTNCGTLVVNVADSKSQPLLNAQVRVVNSTTNPTIDVTTYADGTGRSSLPGAPVASNYQVTVTKTGYSTEQTYPSSQGNPSPAPANLSVTNGNPTSVTFAGLDNPYGIDQLSQKTVNTFTPVQLQSWTDPLADKSKIASSTNITVAGGLASVSGSAPYGNGEFVSIPIQPAYLAAWKSFNATASTPAGTSVLYRFYDATGQNLIPDTALPGNAAGFSSNSTDLSRISTTTYPGLVVGGWLMGSDATPSIDSYSVSYLYGPSPLPNIPFTLQGAKTIGNNPIVYKYTNAFSSGSGASVALPNLAFDTYTLSVPSSSGYDISSACHPLTELVASPSSPAQFSLQPGTQTQSSIYLVPHTAYSLIVEARYGASGAEVPQATIELSKTGYDSVRSADNCGQAFFSSLSQATYTYAVGAPGYATSTGQVSVFGSSRATVTIN